MGKIVIKLEEGDKLAGIERTNGEDEIILATARGMVVRFSEKQIRKMGRNTYGNIGIRFKEKTDRVIGMVVRDKDTALLTIYDNGFGRRSSFDEYRLYCHRGGKGVKNISPLAKQVQTIGVLSIKDDDEVLLATKLGYVIRIPAKQIRQIGRRTKGVKLATLHQNDRLISAAKVPHLNDKNNQRA